MNLLEIGYATGNINPELGIGVYGYYVPRFAKGILDDLESTALALRCGDKTFVIVSIDNGGLKKDDVREVAERIEALTGLDKNSVFVSATHTHTAPLISDTFMFDADIEPIKKYRALMIERTAEAVKLALEDLSPARMGFATGVAPDRVSYIRRYKMKDGTTQTCPPIDDPNIDHPIGEIDRRVHVLRFAREDKPDVVLFNYGLHADTVNGELISADWPGQLKKTLKDALGVECITVIGAEGDVGSTNVHPRGGDMNDTEISFDNEMKSPGMARFIGRALAGTVLQVFDKVEFSDVESIDMLKKDIHVPSNMPTADELPRAREYARLHDEGRDDLIPFDAMELTTVVAEAIRMVRLADGPEYFTFPLTGLRIGGVALLGIPGEPFTGIGVGIKEAEGWDLVIPAGLSGGYEGYFPMKSAFDEGGYEARTSPFKSGVAELIIDEGKKLLVELKSKQ